jgi:hypothetical protein
MKSKDPENENVCKNEYLQESKSENSGAIDEPCCQSPDSVKKTTHDAGGKKPVKAQEWHEHRQQVNQRIGEVDSTNKKEGKQTCILDFSEVRKIVDEENNIGKKKIIPK